MKAIEQYVHHVVMFLRILQNEIQDCPLSFELGSESGLTQIHIKDTLLISSAVSLRWSSGNQCGTIHFQVTQLFSSILRPIFSSDHADKANELNLNSDNDIHGYIAPVIQKRTYINRNVFWNSPAWGKKPGINIIHKSFSITVNYLYTMCLNITFVHWKHECIFHFPTRVTQGQALAKFHYLLHV